jgi:hypothetical protein
LFYDSSNKSFYCGRFDEGNKYKSSTIKLPNELYKILFCGNIKGTDIYPSQTSILFSSDKELSSSKPLKTQDPSDSHSDSTRKLAFYLLPINEKTMIDESKSFMRWNLIPGNFRSNIVIKMIRSICKYCSMCEYSFYCKFSSTSWNFKQ